MLCIFDEYQKVVLSAYKAHQIQSGPIEADFSSGLYSKMSIAGLYAALEYLLAGSAFAATGWRFGLEGYCVAASPDVQSSPFIPILPQVIWGQFGALENTRDVHQEGSFR